MGISLEGRLNSHSSLDIDPIYIDMSNFNEIEQTRLSFKDNITKRLDEPYLTFRKAYQNSDNDLIRFIDINNPLHPRIASKALVFSKYDVLEIQGRMITAKKRETIRETALKERIELIEPISDEDLNQAHIFISSCFSESNFDNDVDSQFDLHSDYLIAQDRKTREIYAVTRLTYNSPNKPLPLQFATDLSTGENFILPNHKEKIAEVLSVNNGEELGFLSFMVSLKLLAPHLGKLGVDHFYTTCKTDNKKAKKLYTRHLKLESTGKILKYGDLEGEWELLSGSRELIQKSIQDPYGIFMNFN